MPNVDKKIIEKKVSKVVKNQEPKVSETNNNSEANQKSKFQLTLNIVSLGVIVLLIVFGAYYALKSNGILNKNNSEEINGITFVSDGNIISQLIEFKDSEKIYIYGKIDKERTNMVEVNGALMLYLQIFSALQRQFSTYTFYEENQSCHIFDLNKSKMSVGNKQFCDNIILNEGHIIIIETPDPSLEHTKVIIENNILRVYSKDYSEVFFDNRKLIEIIVPELKDIEEKIKAYVGNVGTKLS